jgi:hypothetical protein
MKPLPAGRFFEDTRSPFVRQHGFLCEMAKFREARGEGSFKEMMREYGLVVTDEMARHIKRELS